MSGFCANILSPKNYKSQTLIREKLLKALSFKKCSQKMLMKLTPVFLRGRAKRVITLKNET